MPPSSRANELARARHISRRRLLATAGVTLTLPLLPSLFRGKDAKADACGPNRRFLAYMFSNGHHMPEHLPTGVGVGDAWQLPPMLEAFADVKQHLTFVSGLENQQRRQEVGDHAIGCAAMLTARKATKNAPILSMSVDQAIADEMATCRTGLHSLQLGTHNIGPKDEFGTFYTRSISFRGQAIAGADGSMTYPHGEVTPLGKEVDPRLAFDRLFAGADPHATAKEREMRRALRLSVLDTVTPQITSLSPRLGIDDRRKVDELLTGIRSLELEIEAQAALDCVPPEAPPEDALADFSRQLDVLHEIMAVALSCDVTRVITFMMGDGLSDRNVAFIEGVGSRGGSTGDHAISHHSNVPDLVAKFRDMVLWKMARIASFVRLLSEKTDPDGTPLIDNCLVMISSEIADGNRHNHDDHPILLAGGLGGLVDTNRHVRFPTSNDWSQVKTYGDFFITLLSLFDVRATGFGDDGKEAIEWHRA